MRLAGIDAPEKSQAFGQASKKHLSEVVFGESVVVELQKLDRYGRLSEMYYLRVLMSAFSKSGKAWLGTTKSMQELRLLAIGRHTLRLRLRQG